MIVYYFSIYSVLLVTLENKMSLDHSDIETPQRANLTSGESDLICYWK